jgi:hypothetical protein
MATSTVEKTTVSMEADSVPDTSSRWTARLIRGPCQGRTVFVDAGRVPG